MVQIVINATFFAALLVGQLTRRPAIRVTDCVVTSGERLPGIVMRVGFVNESDRTITRIVWRGKYGDGWVDFTDAGVFAPGIKITHDLWFGRNFRFRSPFQNYEVQGAQNCTLIASAGADGSRWEDSSVAAETKRLPDAPRDDAVTVPPSITNPLGDPVGIVGCNLGLEIGKGGGSGELSVRFRNLSTKTIDRIVFRGFYGTGGFDFTYGGTFAPGTLINSSPHHGVAGRLIRSDLPPQDPPTSYQSLDSPDNCTALSAHFTDGTAWRNPTIETVPLPSPAPAKPPSLRGYGVVGISAPYQ